MNSKEWLDGLNYKNIDSKYRDIVYDIGLDNFITLSSKFGGTTIYIPKLKTIYSEEIRRYILKEYNGKNTKKLAIKFDYSERTIQNIINFI